MTPKERLQELRDRKSGDSTTIELVALSFKDTEDRVAELEREVEGIKETVIEPGYTPIKGQDYFTQEEVDSIIAFVQSNVRNGEQGPKGEKGDTGERGPRGASAVRGIDYWTEEDRAKIYADIQKLIPKIESAPPVDVQGIVNAALKTHSVAYKDIKDAPDLKSLEDLIKFLKAGGFRGGGSSGNSAVVWGDIGGSLPNQTDLQNALDLKASKSFAIAMAVAL